MQRRSEELMRVRSEVREGIRLTMAPPVKAGSVRPM